MSRPPHLAQGLALFLGAFTLLNILGELRIPGFDANHWWIDLQLLPVGLSRGFLALCGLALLTWAAWPRGSQKRLTLTLGLVVLLLCAVATNVITWYWLLFSRQIRCDIPIPLSLFIFLALGRVARALQAARTLDARALDARALDARTLDVRTPDSRAPDAKAQEESSPPETHPVGQEAPNLEPGQPGLHTPRFIGRLRGVRPRQLSWQAVAVAILCVPVFSLAQMCLLGLTDYRRPAQAIVVLGALIHADGSLSSALEDRVRMGVALYQAGYAPLLVMSGGPGPGKIHETEGMARYAVEHGVPAEAIVRDPHGLSTHHTVRNTQLLFRQLGISRVLVVSHFYHLLRIKLDYRRYGLEVATVPAPQSVLLLMLPYYVLRELAALWSYYLRPLGIDVQALVEGEDVGIMPTYPGKTAPPG